MLVLCNVLAGSAVIAALLFAQVLLDGVGHVSNCFTLRSNTYICLHCVIDVAYFGFGFGCLICQRLLSYFICSNPSTGFQTSLKLRRTGRTSGGFCALTVIIFVGRGEIKSCAHLRQSSGCYVSWCLCSIECDDGLVILKNFVKTSN